MSASSSRTPLQTVLGWFTAEGSTRAAAIIRIGFVFLLWNSLTIQTSVFKWLTQPLLAASCLVLSVASVTLIVGFFARISAALVAIATAIICWWFGAMEGMRPFQGITGVWLTAVLVAFLPVGGSFSVDRWLAVRRARRRNLPVPPERAPTWGFILIRLQLSAIYTFAALDKIDAEWLAGERLERLVVNYYGYAEILRDMPWIHLICVVMAWFTTVAEFSLGVLIWIKPLRRYILPVGVVLHLGFFVLLALWPLSQRMILLYLAFIDPDAVHRWIDGILGRSHDDGRGEANLEANAASPDDAHDAGTPEPALTAATSPSES